MVWNYERVITQRAEAQFNVLITSDHNWKHQQNLGGVQIAIIQLPTNQVPKVIKLALAVQASLNTIQPGDFVAIPITSALS